MVYGVCLAMLRDVHDAEDATQQVFLSAHTALLGGVNVRDQGRWLATIARNECRARIVAGMRRPLVVDKDLEGLAAHGDEQHRRAQVEEIRAALAALPERQREAAILLYLYGFRYREVATALGLSRPATEALLFRARRALRVRLRPVAGAALAVPSIVREELALALPGFGRGGAATGSAAVGVTSGVLAKFAAGSAGSKAVTAAVAVSTVGAVGVVPSEGPDRVKARPATVAAIQQRSSPVPGVELASTDGARDASEQVDRSTRSGHQSRESSGPGSGEDRGADHGDAESGPSGPSEHSSGPTPGHSAESSSGQESSPESGGHGSSGEGDTARVDEANGGSSQEGSSSSGGGGSSGSSGSGELSGSSGSAGPGSSGSSGSGESGSDETVDSDNSGSGD